MADKQNKTSEQTKISKSKHVDLENRVVTRGKGTEAGTLKWVKTIKYMVTITQSVYQHTIGYTEIEI